MNTTGPCGDLRNGEPGHPLHRRPLQRRRRRPSVDTILMLRPTESATLFLQQLGRGLRKADGKAVCTVLDFVGMHRKEFRFDLRYRALLGGSRADLTTDQTRLPVPPGRLPHGARPGGAQRRARQHQVGNPEQLPPTSRRAPLDRRRVAGEFLDKSGLELTDVYAGSAVGQSSAEPPASSPLSPTPLTARRSLARSDGSSTSTTTSACRLTQTSYPTTANRT